jgi:hypothetical protein
MKSRWLLNLILLLAVGGIAAFLYLRPQPVDTSAKNYVVSTLAPSSFSKLTIEHPARKPVLLEKQNGNWRLMDPYQSRADEDAVGAVLAIAIATSHHKFPASKAAQYGLDKPALKVRIGNEEFSFGMYNPLSGEQYVGYKDSIYLVPSIYSESASLKPEHFIDKNPIGVGETLAGFDFSHLEQWESSHLNLDYVDGTWKVSVAGAKPNQKELDDWFSSFWQKIGAKSVEPYKPDGKPHPWFAIKLKGGKVVHFDKLQETPELLMARPDEGMIYHFPQDIGFSLLNPPVGLAK